MLSAKALRRREFKRYVKTLVRWSWLFGLLIVIGAGSAYAVSARAARGYTAAALLLVSTNGKDPYSNILASNQLVQTYLSLIDTPAVVDRAAGQVRGVSPNSLATNLSVSNPGVGTQIIQIQVTNASPERAARLANAVATSFIQLERGLTHTSDIRVFQPAFPPANPNHVSRLNIAAGGLAGLLLAAGLIWILETLDDRVQTVDEVEEVTGLPVVGAIGREGGQPSLLSRDPDSLLSESFRILRANLGSTDAESIPSLIAVTSALPREGKTTVSINLATSLTMAGKRVLLVDANLLYPSIHGSLGLPNEVGLTTILLERIAGRRTSGQAAGGEVAGLARLPGTETHPVSVPRSFARLQGFPNLYVMTAGPLPPDPVELLTSGQLDAVLRPVLPSDSRQGLVDVVVVDMPAVSSLPEAALLTAPASATLLVVDIKRTHENEVVSAERILRRGGARLVGVVVNRVTRSELRGYDRSHAVADAELENSVV